MNANTQYEVRGRNGVKCLMAVSVTVWIWVLKPILCCGRMWDNPVGAHSGSIKRQVLPLNLHSQPVLIAWSVIVLFLLSVAEAFQTPPNTDSAEGKTQHVLARVAEKHPSTSCCTFRSGCSVGGVSRVVQMYCSPPTPPGGAGSVTRSDRICSLSCVLWV